MWGQALLLLLFLQHSKSDPHTDSACKNLRCFADYVQMLTCLWEIGPDALRGKLPNITATWGDGRGGTCTFQPTFRNASHMQYTCSSEQKPCIFGQTFVVTVAVLVDGAHAIHQECQPFHCHENIKLRPPFNVTAAACPGGYNISWESGYVANDYLHGELQYQLRYRQKGHPWSPTEGGVAGALKPVLQDTPTLWLLAQELEGGVEYELQVRARPRYHSAYQGTWSDWSPTSSFQTPPRDTAGAAWVVSLLLAFSLMVTLVAFLCKHQRPWKKLDPFIPSPAPFFQTLYLAHNGDVKAAAEWCGRTFGQPVCCSYGFQHRRVDCTWLRRNQTWGEGPFYLTFYDTFEQGLKDLVCWLSPSNKTQDEFRCSAEGSGEFQENDEYNVSLHDASLGEKASYAVWEDIYNPMRNIKCDPPYDFRSNMSGNRCLITWKMPKAYVLIWKDMRWQLQLRATHVPWEQAETKARVSEETWMEIDAAEFTPGTSYVARLRCKNPDKNDVYVSHWSEWSSTTEWSVPPGPLPQVLLPVFVSVPLCLGALLCLLLLARCHSRIKRCCWPSPPNPAAFFLPLYASHRGDFQAWIGIKKQDVWLRDGGSSSSIGPGKRAGPGLVTHQPLEEAVSQLSLFRHLSEAELPAEARVHHLLGAPDQQDKASNYVVIQGAAQVPVVPGTAPLLLEGLNDASEGFPYLPYKNSLFVA